MLQNRFVEGATDNIIQALQWAGLSYAEGPEVGGTYLLLCRVV